MFKFRKSKPARTNSKKSYYEDKIYTLKNELKKESNKEIRHIIMNNIFYCERKLAAM